MKNNKFAEMNLDLDVEHTLDSVSMSMSRNASYERRKQLSNPIMPSYTPFSP